MKIGPYQLNGQVILAPMAGVTDLPYRKLCRSLGAALAVSEMVTSKANLWHTQKTQTRLQHDGEIGPISVQIAGTDPLVMAKAAQFNVQQGAQIIDINMGCPAKKVCNVQAGSALLKNEDLVRQICSDVVNAVDVPVTLKIRTGWDKKHKNALSIARIAEEEGIQALAIHGRTRECAYTGDAEYEQIKNVKENISIPIIANGDIDSVEKAQYVLQYTDADAIMLGRYAQKNPWAFREINHYLQTGKTLSKPRLDEIKSCLLELLEGIYSLYGSQHGVRVARKHIKTFIMYWLYDGLTIKSIQVDNELKNSWSAISKISDAKQQYQQVSHLFS